MTDHRDAPQDVFQQWAATVAESSTPIEVGEIFASGPSEFDGVDAIVRAPLDDLEPPFLDELSQELPTMRVRNIVLMVGAVAAAAIVAFLVFTGSGGDGVDGTDIAAESGDPTATSQSDRSAPTTPVEIATAFWEAVAAGDRDTAIALADPDSPDANLFGRAGAVRSPSNSIGMRWSAGSGSWSSVWTLMASPLIVKPEHRTRGQTQSAFSRRVEPSA